MSSSDNAVKSTGDTTFVLEQTSAPETPGLDLHESTTTTRPAQTESGTQTPAETHITAGAMASAHTEPTHQHTKEELLHPGRDHHLAAPPPCPDPSAHRDSRLQEQASTAALYSTKPAKDTESILDANNKLSSRSE